MVGKPVRTFGVAGDSAAPPPLLGKKPKVVRWECRPSPIFLRFAADFVRAADSRARTKAGSKCSTGHRMLQLVHRPSRIEGIVSTAPGRRHAYGEPLVNARARRVGRPISARPRERPATDRG